MADEAAFLPAALSLQETPSHPAPRRLAWAICLFSLAALVWSLLGEVDIVAIAPGRVIVSERSKVIQPLQAGVVRRLLVRDGDKVQAGQVLVELDPTLASADSANAAEQLAYARSEKLRATALIEALERSAPPVLGPDEAPQVRSQLNAEWRDIRARLARLDVEHARRKAEMATVRETILKLDSTLSMVKSREEDFKRLALQGAISGHMTEDKTRERVELERDLSLQHARLIEARLAVEESIQTRASFTAETLRSLQDRLAQASSRHDQIAQEHTKAAQRERLTRLIAPVAGTIQQLAVHTEGGVVTEAQALMVVVPEEADVRAEVILENKDIGFVHAGQHATVKMDTFLYTRYGTVPATVRWVTADAVNDEKRGAVFPTILTLESTHMGIDGVRVKLSAGMSLVAEIKTGKRRVIDYLLSPIQRAAGESLRER